MRDGFHDISRHQHLEAKQERSANANLIDLGILPRHGPSQMEIGGPGDADHDDEDTEDLDPAPDHPDGMIGQRFEILEGDRIVHIGASGNVRPASRAASATLPEPAVDPIATSLSRST